MLTLAVGVFLVLDAASVRITAEAILRAHVALPPGKQCFSAHITLSFVSGVALAMLHR